MKIEGTLRKLLRQAVPAYVHDCAARRTAARVDELAERLGRNPSYLSRAAGLALGRQLHTALREEQLLIAEHLLRMTDLPIKEVAIRAAFGTASTFFRVFRKAYGERPSEYRARTQK